MAWAVEQQAPDQQSKHLLLVLANYADSNKTCFPSVKRLARDTQMSESTVKRKLKLLNGSLIQITQRTKHGVPTSNLYRLLTGGRGQAEPTLGVRVTYDPINMIRREKPIRRTSISSMYSALIDNSEIEEPDFDS